jgi:hypothetical protein
MVHMEQGKRTPPVPATWLASASPGEHSFPSTVSDFMKTCITRCDESAKRLQEEGGAGIDKDALAKAAEAQLVVDIKSTPIDATLPTAGGDETVKAKQAEVEKMRAYIGKGSGSSGQTSRRLTIRFTNNRSTGTMIKAGD